MKFKEEKGWKDQFPGYFLYLSDNDKTLPNAKIFPVEDPNPAGDGPVFHLLYALH
jgi:hypothetical protein